MNEQLIRIILDILLIIVIILGILWKAVKDKKSGNPGNPGSLDLEMIPGHSKECRIRGDAITKLTANHEFVCTQITQINTNVSNIWKYVRKNGIG